jgi:catechol 2,3-dioxygenase-like lactoylglutathione lyase family enzyme
MPSLFPVLCSRDVRRSADFYSRLLGLRSVFDSDWYVQLQHPEDATVQLAFVQRDHPTVPQGHRRDPAGVLVTMERDDVDEVYARACGDGLTIALDLRDEDFGQRHFMTVDPDGVLVDVVRIIAPTAEFADGYIVAGTSVAEP